VLFLEEVARLVHNPSAEWRVILHAAALAHAVTNHAIILAAPTGCGKSTLTAALLHSPAFVPDSTPLRLLSDDSAAVTTDNKLLALPFALMLRSGSWPVLQPSIPEVAELPTVNRFGEPVRFLPPAVSFEPAIPKHLVFVNYRPDVPDAQLEPLDPFSALVHLQKSGFWVPHDPTALSAFVSWISALPSYELTYSALPQAISTLNQLLGSTS
jgi:hypothetical protein